MVCFVGVAGGGGGEGEGVEVEKEERGKEVSERKEREEVERDRARAWLDRGPARISKAFSSASFVASVHPSPRRESTPADSELARRNEGRREGDRDERERATAKPLCSLLSTIGGCRARLDVDAHLVSRLAPSDGGHSRCLRCRKQGTNYRSTKSNRLRNRQKRDTARAGRPDAKQRRRPPLPSTPTSRMSTMAPTALTRPLFARSDVAGSDAVGEIAREQSAWMRTELEERALLPWHRRFSEERND